MKKCCRCQIVKDLAAFPNNRSTVDFKHPECKACANARSKVYRSHTLEQRKEYMDANRARINQKRRENYKRNKDTYISRHKKYQKQRRNNDPIYKLMCNLRTRLYHAVKKDFKVGSAIRDLGCSISHLKKHLEARFTLGMCWENYGKWHIDHIVPLASFDLTNLEEFKKACCYTNLQPMWAIENIVKGCKNQL